NGSTSEGTLAWGQTLTGEIPDKYPVLDGARVYKTNPCLSYTNDINSINKNHDDFDNGFCKKCGYYQPATVVSADNHQELGESYYDYYAIENAGQLYWFAGLVNGTLTDGTEKNTAANAILTADITVNKNVLESGNLSSNTSGFRSWTPIGDDTNYYNGTFDGNGKTVSGLYFNDRTDYVGLFGYKSDGIVRNVGVIDSYFNGRRYVGGVSGYNINCTITNCYFTGAVNGSSYVGGVCGEIVYSDIANCYNLGAVSGSSYVGGMCGKNGDVNCTINNCYYLEGCNADDTTFDCLVGTSKTAAQFASGEVAYLLQGEQTTAVWGQKLTGDDKQDYPVLGGEHVYQCTECTAKYSNTQGEKGEHTAPDTYDNGFGTCTACGEEVYQPATLNGSTYEISNAGQLYWFAEQVNSDNENFGSANAVLTANITVNTGVLDASGNLVSNTSGFRSWTPIGSDESKAYVGTFDGNGKTVSGLYFNNTDAGYVGLFGYSTGTIKNVGVVDSYFNGANYVGGVFGKIESVTIENCYSKSSVNGAENIGGVCGYVGYFSGIKNCYNTGAVSGSKYVGGVCGEISSYGFIANCYNTGTVSKTGTVSDSDFVGGVCGDNSADEEKAIKNCYYLSGTAAQGVGWGSGSAESKTEDEFNSGEVAYLLSQGCTIGSTTYSGEVWGQTLTGDDKQDYPVLGGAKVYLTTPCPTGYSNTENETKAHKDADEDGICDECGAKFAYIVSLLTEADGTPSVANPSGGGKFSTGDKTTITAEAVPGYTFNGWYKEDGTLVTANLSFEFTVEAEDVTFTAKYQANAEMLITINGGDSYSVAVNNLDPSNFSGQKKTNYAVGTKLTLTANGADFAYWENEAGSVLSRSAEYTFTVVNSATVTAVYNTKADGKATVIFISGYDQIIARDQYASGVDVPVPSAPTKTGCDFAGWSINGGEAVTENVADAVKTAITNALATETTADDIINVKATYNAKTETITVTVVNGTGTGTYTINAVVTVKANEPESGFKFSHWTDGTNTLSYNTSYSFYAAKDITVEAVYVADTEKVAAVGTTEMAEVIRDTSTGTITFVTMSNVPEGCTILKAGLVITSNANVGNSGDSFNDTTAKAYGNSWSGSAYRFSFSLKSAKTFYARAYLVYTDKNGNTNTVYGDMISASVND
ncbi:MAG: GLUG motif-containing protein, partial [Ruminiclostridium sp.]